jgi:hypothetical protein
MGVTQQSSAGGGVSSSALNTAVNTAVAAALAFNGELPMTRNTPGILGDTPHGNNVVDVLKHVIYPDIPPGASIGLGNTPREVGSSRGYTLAWYAFKGTNPITAIVVDGQSITPTGVNQNGTISGNVSAAIGSYTKNMLVTAGADSAPASITLDYLYPVIYGSIAKDGSSGNPILDSDILSITLTKNLTTTRALNLSNFGGGNLHLIFVWPHAFDSGNVAAFKVNGLSNTAFTKVRSNSNFTNAFGFTYPIDVWVSNNLYNSPLSSVEVI